MIANVASISNRRGGSGLAIRAARWRRGFSHSLTWPLNLCTSFAFDAILMLSKLSGQVTHGLFCAICCPHGSPLPRDKDMSDNKAIITTIRVFLVVEFCISPGEAGQFIHFQWYFTLK